MKWEMYRVSREEEYHVYRLESDIPYSDPVITRYDWITDEVQKYYFLCLFHESIFMMHKNINWPTLKEAQEEIEMIYHGG